MCNSVIQIDLFKTTAMPDVMMYVYLLIAEYLTNMNEYVIVIREDYYFLVEFASVHEK